MARSPIIIDPPNHHERTPTIPGLPAEEMPQEDEHPTGPGLDTFFNTPTAVPIASAVAVEVDSEDDWEEMPPPRATGIPDWAPVAAMCLCAAVGMWALVDRLLV